MIVLEKPHQNLSEYNQYLFKKDLNLVKKWIISSEKMRNLGNYIYFFYLKKIFEVNKKQILLLKKVEIQGAFPS